MVTDSAAIVMFAIRSAVKLAHQLRLAYIDSAKRRDLILPLPGFSSVPDLAAAAAYFHLSGKRHVDQVPRLAGLFQKNENGPPLTPDETVEMLQFHAEFFNLDNVEKGFTPKEAGAVLNIEEFKALITIRQWKRGTDPNPPVIQRVAGALVEIGIDYAVNVPGAFHQDSPHGKAVAGFLNGLAEINFSEMELKDLPTRLFFATLDTLSEESGLLSGDPKVQELIKVTTKGLSTDVARRLAENQDNLVAQERISDWADLVFRSVLSSGGRLVVSDPKRFLGVGKPGEIEVVSKVGDALLGLVLDHPDERLDRVFGREGLNTVVKAALTAVGEHPEILHINQTGLQKLLGEVASQLSQHDNVLTPDILPEVARLVLDKTGENLALLWPDLANDPAKNLALTAARTTLDILTREPAAGATWKIRFSRDDLLAVSEATLAELVTNPGWLITKAGAVGENLAAVLEATVGVLRQRGDRRLSPAIAVDLLRATLAAVAQRQEFLDKIPGGGPLVAVALDTILTQVFDPSAKSQVQWRLVQSVVIHGLVRVALEQLARARLRPELIGVLKTVLNTQVQQIADGKPWDLNGFEADLEEALEAA